MTAGPADADITAVDVIDDTHLRVSLDDGRTGVFDVEPYLNYPAFMALRNPVYFRMVSVRYGAVCWPNGEDFAPETVACRVIEAAGHTATTLARQE